MYKIKDENIFTKYVAYRLSKALSILKETARQQLVDEKIKNGTDSHYVQFNYIGSKIYVEELTIRKNLLKRQLSAKYNVFSAAKDPEILDEYSKIEDKAIAIASTGKEVNFDIIDYQYRLIDFYCLQIDQIINENDEAIRENIKKHIENYFSSKVVVVNEEIEEDFDRYDFSKYRYYEPEVEEKPLDEDNYYCLDSEICDGETILYYMDIHSEATGFTDEFLVEQFCFSSPETIKLIYEKNFIKEAIEAIRNSKTYENLEAELQKIWTEEHALEVLKTNPNHVEMFRILRERKEAAEKERLEAKRAKEEANIRKAAILKNIVQQIPEKIEDFFPAARNLHRRFVLHVGPTNSGKTHDAIEAMKNAKNGVYLAPLRLLAYEQYETLNADGFPCDMLTGEEAIRMENSRFISSTIEMLSLEKQYSVAVIDEAQMIVDNNRGGAWLRAILGVLADEIHVCMAPEALELIKELVEACGDEYIVKEHQRMTDLKIDEKKFDFPRDVCDGDALIVFSRRDAHAVARELQNRKRKVSILYGNLPHDVRHKEAEKFASGEKSIVVSTDCIGMGMNLPIKRVVFLETAKFDGKEVRLLTAAEIKQIAGRAGRYGIYNEGLVNSFENKKTIQKALSGDVQNITCAFVSFPESLIGIEGSLSEIIDQWNQVKLPGMLKKENTEDLLSLAKSLEYRHAGKNKIKIYELASIPFDTKNTELREVWKELSDAIMNEKGKEEINLVKYIPSVPDKTYTGDDLSWLEEQSQLCDLLYNFSRKFGLGYTEEISIVRNEISEKIMSVLDSSKLTNRKCKRCGKALPWNHPYGICEDCYYSGRYNYDYY